MTICPLTAYKNKGSFFNMENVLNNTYGQDQLFAPSTIFKFIVKQSKFIINNIYNNI
jgi:hypothetical protein